MKSRYDFRDRSKNALGCVEFYKTSDYEDRKKWMLSKGVCLKKDSSGRHKCNWTGKGKFLTRCMQDNCGFNAVMCKFHKANKSAALVKWLTSVGINPNSIVQTIMFNKAPIKHAAVSSPSTS